MRKPRKDRGWVLYPLPPNHVGNINENIETILSLVGSICYEWQRVGSEIYVRRID